MDGMQKLINAIKGHVGSMLAGIGANRIGIVTDVDPARHLARVTVQPDGTSSGWLPVTSPWGISLLPYVGQQVLTASQEHDGEHMHILGGVFSSQNPPPMAPSAFAPNQPSGGSPDQSGNPPTHVTPGTEILLTNPSGATVRLTPDGNIYIKGPTYVDGDLFVNGDVYDYHGPMDRLRRHYNAHVHPDVMPGESNTPVTTQQDPE